jgi:hypothetical protein
MAKPFKAIDQITEPLPAPPKPVTLEDLERLERIIRDLADRKYVCPFNDRLILLLEHDEKTRDMLQDHDHDINGNDVPGMKDNVRTLMSERADRSKLNWLLVAAVIGNFLAILLK